MNDVCIVRPRLAFEREFGQHRNWWVRDPRICGNPVSIYLFLLSHEEGRQLSQIEARTQLGLGERAWVTAKKALLETGFLVEVRDRYPDGYVDAAGNPRGRQRRFRLFLQDPEPLVSRTLEEAVLELDLPYEEWLEQQEMLVSAKRREGDSPVSAKRRDGEESQVSPTLQNADTVSPSLRNADTFIGRENHGWLVSNTSPSNQPTKPAVDGREAEAGVDAELASLHPELRLTSAQIRHEVNGRVPLDEVDVVQVVRDTVLATAARGKVVRNPAALVAAVLVRNPGGWPMGAGKADAFAPMLDSAETRGSGRCVTGDHWWGSEAWSELDRSHCVECGQPRRDVDTTFAALEAELIAVGGEK